MRQKSVPEKEPAREVVKKIRRATRRHFSAEDKIRIVLEGLRGEDSIAELCRRARIISCRAPQYEPSRPLQHALCHELCGPSRCERGARPFRDVRHRGAWPPPRGDGRHA